MTVINLICQRYSLSPNMKDNLLKKKERTLSMNPHEKVTVNSIIYDLYIYTYLQSNL